MIDRLSVKQLLIIIFVAIAVILVGVVILILGNDSPGLNEDLTSNVEEENQANGLLADTVVNVQEATYDYPEDSIVFTINVFERGTPHAGGWDFWVWTPDGAPGGIIGGGGGRFSSDTMIVSPFSGDEYQFLTVTLRLLPETDRVGFLLRLPPTEAGGWDDWGRQTGDVIAFLDIDEDGNPTHTTIFHVLGTSMVTPNFPYMGGLAVTAIADWHNYIRATLLESDEGFNSNGFELRDVTGVSWQDGRVIPISSVSEGVSHIAGGAGFPIFHIYTEEKLNPQRHYQLAYEQGQIETGGINVLMRGILDQFDYDGWLGHRWFSDRSEFKLWAPTAAQVQVALYRDLNQVPGQEHYEVSGGMRVLSSFVTEPYELFEMTRNSYGVWSAEIAGDWADGDVQWWYMFKVTHAQGHVTFAIDPHVTAVSANEGIGAILNDLQRGMPLRGDDNLTFLQRGYRYVNGEREYVERVAPELRVNPVNGHPYQVDHVIYELHVRDFSIHPSSGITPQHRGTFMAFTERGTVARVHQASESCTASTPFEVSLCSNEDCWVIPQDENGDNIYVSTGLDHLIELGVTTVHLLPFYDQRHVNELDPNRQVYNTRHAMNWGYDPQNYNVPEGTYSTDPTIPYLRIQELKAAIDAMHNVGIRVVKDVVYNHTASVTDGPFQASVPYYFHRTWCTGMIAGGGSGVGNELADERPMVRRYIVDSLLYWQREFGIDGFRFDLMWLHDIHTMTAAIEALRAVDPTVIIYGEPWAASPQGSPLNYPALFQDSLGNLREAFTQPPLPSNTQNITGNGFAFFNDNTRNMLRGGNRSNQSGFVNEHVGGGVVGDVWRSIRANTPNVAFASESINYISKHDDMIIFDNSAWSLGAERGGIDAPGFENWSTASFFSQYGTLSNEAFRHDPHHMINRDDLFGNYLVRSVTFGTGIILTSQGVPFLHAADSFLRSKRGHENTFNSDDFFNAIRWDHKVEFFEVHKYFAGLINLRNSRPAFRLDSREDINSSYHVIFPNPPASVAPGGQDLLLVYRIGEYAGGDSWRNIFVAYNGASEERVVNFVWHELLNVVVDYRNAGVEVLWTIEPREAIVVPPFSMIVAFDIEMD